MVLKRIELFGFKSFPDRTVLEFPEGITAIVGSNGCGKSNVSDAIRWVLGEQSAKSLRGDQMLDLIFSGTASRKPLNLAEVILTFDNAHGLFPVEFTEVSIGRRLFRDGTSSYLLNKQECRLRDIYDLLMDSGIGRRAHAIIEQGKIDEIVTAKPEERRQIIEEAAGIAKYRSRRADALRRLEATREGLRRVDDLILELERQDQSLKRQARKAERHRELTAELRRVELTHARARAAELEAQLAESGERVAGLDESLTRMDVELAELSVAITAGRERLEIARRRLREAGQELSEAEKASSAAESRLHEMQARQEDDARSIAAVAAEIESLDARLAAAAEARRRAEEEHRALAETLSGLEARRAEAALARDDRRAAVAEARRLAEDLAAARRAADAARARLASEEDFLARTITGLDERDASIASQLAEASAQRQALEVEASGARAELERATQAVDEAAAVRVEAEERATASAHRFEAATLSLHAAERELAVISSRLEAASARAAAEAEVVEDASRSAGCPLDPIGEAIGVGAEHAAAVAAALGDVLHGVVARGESVDLEAVAARLPGRPVVAIGSARFASGWVPRPGLVPLAGVLLPETPSVFRSLLAGWYLATDDVIAASQLPLLAENERLVTLEGSIHWPFGARRVPSAGTGEELSAVRAVLSASKNASAAAVTVAEEEREEARMARDEARLAVVSTQAALDDRRVAARRIESRLSGLQARLADSPEAVLAQDRLQVASERAAAEARLEAVRVERALAVEALASHEEEQAKVATGVRVAEEASEAAQQELAVLDVELGRARERLTGLAAEGARQAQWEAESASARARYAGMQSEIAARQERLAAAIGDLRGEVAALTTTLADRRSTFAACETECADLEIENTALEETGRALSRNRETAVASRHAAEMAQMGIRGDLAVIRDRVREKYGIEDLAAIVVESAPAVGEGALEGGSAASANRVEELKEALERLGGVNWEAQQELDEVVRRLDFYRVQREDLAKAENGLTSVVGDIDQRTSALFQETFRAVNTNFGLLFNRLFGAKPGMEGSAELVLLDPENPLESGIDIVAMPPGKKPQTISLLSGGEKALTAVALLFAVFLVRPSPFAVLDELDAPLDEANVGKYVQLLQEFSQRTQFLIITHNKRTMEAADTLYGVTQAEKGISTILGVRMAAGAARSADASIEGASGADAIPEAAG